MRSDYPYRDEKAPEGNFRASSDGGTFVSNLRADPWERAGPGHLHEMGRAQIGGYA